MEREIEERWNLITRFIGFDKNLQDEDFVAMEIRTAEGLLVESLSRFCSEPGVVRLILAYVPVGVYAVSNGVYTCRYETRGSRLSYQTSCDLPMTISIGLCTNECWKELPTQVSLDENDAYICVSPPDNLGCDCWYMSAIMYSIPSLNVL